MDEFAKQDMQTFALFQFMIGNADWRIPFMRNIKFIEPNDKGKLIPIPYDFDVAGMVDANYAKPDRDFKIEKYSSKSFYGKFWQ